MGASPYRFESGRQHRRTIDSATPSAYVDVNGVSFCVVDFAALKSREAMSLPAFSSPRTGRYDSVDGALFVSMGVAVHNW